jgi:transcriptional regulator with XRE-family HTH domain
MAGFSQEELAARSGLHRTYISFLERGMKSPTVDVLMRLGTALGVRASHLLAEAEETWDVQSKSVEG